MGKVVFLKKISGSKKGGEAAETELTELGELVKSVALVIIFVLIITGVYILIKKQNEQGPEESFYQLMTKVKALDEGRFTDGIGQAYYIKDSYYLFGFNVDPEAIRVRDSKDLVNKPQKTGSTVDGTDFCGGEEACLCLCSNHNCDSVINCNTELFLGQIHRVKLEGIKYFVVTEDPKNKFTKGKDIEPQWRPAGYNQGKYFAIFGSNWKNGRLIKLKRNKDVVEITFPPT